MAKCEYCGKEYVKMSHNQRFCSKQCKNKNYWKIIGKSSRFRNEEERKKYNENKKKYSNKIFPSIEFDCPQCGRHIITETGSCDKRTRFCSKECEKKWWKHPPHENESVRQNFRNVKEYIAWEKKTNI